MSTDSPPPRVIVIMRDRGPRALLRAALDEAGYDAIGARTMGEALQSPVAEPDRGAVRLVIVDQRTAIDGNGLLVELLGRHRHAVALLIASSTGAAPAGPWRQVLRRPVRIGEIVAAARALVDPAAPAPGGE